jgi:hypothetical protein
MTLCSPLDDARSVLGVAPGSDAAAVRRAYRRLVASHPPDRDPEAFRRIRDAYELVIGPVGFLRQRLHRLEPLIGPPSAPAAEPCASAPGTTLTALTRAIVMQLELDPSLLDAVTRPPTARPRPARRSLENRRAEPPSKP